MGTEVDPRVRFESMLPEARRLYAEGKAPGDVMRAIYGADLPAEAYALARAFAAGLELTIERTYHPWRLIAAAAPGYATREAGPWERRQEERAFAQLPRFLPLMMLDLDEAARHDGRLLGYDLDELAAGRATIFGHEGELPESGARLERLGDSLLAVLHEWMADHHRFVEAQYRSPANRGFGSISQEDLADVTAKVRAIENLQREVAAAG